SGLGMVANDEDWRSQFIGKSGTLAVTKDGGDIDAITGATITSRAVTAGVNAAVKIVEEVAAK
ncbi:MAG: FMN-binding protein, partial [Oscillospiraceae bacterium]|nr:FMN-binding protein [Oscillospiraceae bacterium]